MHEQFDSLARDLARRDVSRWRFLRLLGGLGGAAALAAVGIRPAGAQEEGDPLMISGHRRSELEALRRDPPPNQAVCAQKTKPDENSPCFLGLCSDTCPGGLLGLGACVPPVQGNGRLRCVAVSVCEPEGCTSNADCGPQEFCARTCCGVANQCVRICAENNP